jgi:hypothetical protein
MKTFSTCAAQGEISIRRISEIPGDAVPLKLEGGKYIVGHSETGHHHVLDRVEGVKVLEAKSAPDGMRILYAILDEPTNLNHLRGHDTHEAIAFQPGMYEFRLGREFDPYAELARRVAD